VNQHISHLTYIPEDRTLRFLTHEEHQRARRREIYGRTTPHADLDQFDAWGMDIIEGRA
jgi:hypothetical protein